MSQFSKTILVSGKNGFIGKNWDNYILKNKIELNTSRLNSDIINNDNKIDSLFKNKFGFLHLCGLAHDLKNTNNSKLYYKINTDYTKKVFDKFLKSETKIFIFISSVKAVADSVENILFEKTPPNPQTHYGKSKFLAEKYILSKKIPDDKKIYILRPSMVHGPENKGNFNLLYLYLKTNLPWPLGSFKNKRSFCSIQNLCFVINKLFESSEIESGIYNVCDSDPISTNELVNLISEQKGLSNLILKIPKFIIITLFKFLDIINFKINSNQLEKLTENYVVSNTKLKTKIGPLPVQTKDGLINTFKSFK